jgi:hypothetical protein
VYQQYFLEMAVSYLVYWIIFLPDQVARRYMSYVYHAPEPMAFMPEATISAPHALDLRASQLPSLLDWKH